MPRFAVDNWTDTFVALHYTLYDYSVFRWLNHVKSIDKLIGNFRTAPLVNSKYLTITKSQNENVIYMEGHEVMRSCSELKVPIEFVVAQLLSSRVMKQSP